MKSFAGFKVALVGPLPPPAGGMANQTRQLAELLTSAGAAVTLVQTNTPYRPAFMGRVPLLRAGFRLVPYLLSLWHAVGRSNLVHVMANSGWSWHLYAAPAIWIGSLRRVPVIVNYRGGEADEFLKRASRLVCASMRRVKGLIVPSEFLQTVFARFGMRAQVVPNIVDLARFSAREARASPSAHLVVARNLELLYDNASALRAFQMVRRHYPEARLTIAGSGPQEQALRSLGAELGITDGLRFTGRLDRNAMADLYRSADLVLNPSLADNMPNSVLEALASGVPVVTTNVGGIPYMVRDRVTALLVPPSTPDALAAACLELLGDDHLWQAIASAGLQEAQRYTWERTAPLLADTYQRALHGPQRPIFGTA